MAAGRIDPESSGVSLENVIEAVADRVGHYWKGLLDTLGLDSQVDGRKIQHECTRQEGGSGSLEKRCADHMFAIWKSRVLSSGVPESQAKQMLLLALQSVPQLESLCRDVENLIGIQREEPPPQTKATESVQLFDTGVYTMTPSMLAEPESPAVSNVTSESETEASAEHDGISYPPSTQSADVLPQNVAENIRNPTSTASSTVVASTPRTAITSSLPANSILPSSVVTSESLPPATTTPSLRPDITVAAMQPPTRQSVTPVARIPPSDTVHSAQAVGRSQPYAPSRTVSSTPQQSVSANADLLPAHSLQQPHTSGPPLPSSFMQQNRMSMNYGRLQGTSEAPQMSNHPEVQFGRSQVQAGVQRSPNSSMLAAKHPNFTSSETLYSVQASQTSGYGSDYPQTDTTLPDSLPDTRMPSANSSSGNLPQNSYTLTPQNMPDIPPFRLSSTTSYSSGHVSEVSAPAMDDIHSNRMQTSIHPKPSPYTPEVSSVSHGSSEEYQQQRSEPYNTSTPQSMHRSLPPQQQQQQRVVSQQNYGGPQISQQQYLMQGQQQLHQTPQHLPQSQLHNGYTMEGPHQSQPDHLQQRNGQILNHSFRAEEQIQNSWQYQQQQQHQQQQQQQQYQQHQQQHQHQQQQQHQLHYQNQQHQYTQDRVRQQHQEHTRPQQQVYQYAQTKQTEPQGPTGYSVSVLSSNVYPAHPTTAVVSGGQPFAQNPGQPDVVEVAHVQPTSWVKHNPNTHSVQSADSGHEDSVGHFVLNLHNQKTLFLILDICLRLRKKKTLGLVLKIPLEEIDQIFMTECESEEQTFQLIKYWILDKTKDPGSEATLDALLDAIKRIQETSCADLIERFLKQSKPQHLG